MFTGQYVHINYTTLISPLPSQFFFQLFADHRVSPPRLDYVSMLQCFAADPNPRQGFIRALSVVLGQLLQSPSLGHLVRVSK